MSLNGRGRGVGGWGQADSGSLEEQEKCVLVFKYKQVRHALGQEKIKTELIGLSAKFLIPGPSMFSFRRQVRCPF